MELVPSDERNRLLARISRDAFHLELRDSYTVTGECDPFARWLRGQPDDLRWHRPWLDLVQRLTHAGRAVRRVRVITEPVSAYIRWIHGLTTVNQEAGEDIRWLPRHQVPDRVRWPEEGNDWWLLDDTTLAVGHFDQHGQVLGSELVTEPGRVDACRATRDLIWTIATPHISYRPA